jgi:NAD(P)-dependent dehydrogenase (short-subunit alcohol dehydrogenase family)
VTSIAGFEVYRGGGGYTGAKHAQRALARTLRLELLGKPVRITEVAPGMVETEFSLVRFGGDEAAASRVREGTRPLRAGDVAECIRWAVAQPLHVNIDEIVVRPLEQATATEVHRRARAWRRVRCGAWGCAPVGTEEGVRSALADAKAPRRSCPCPPALTWIP